MESRPPPVFLSEFKERKYEGTREGAPRDVFDEEPVHSSAELSVRRELEAAKLENVRLREVVISYEMMVMKCQFFGDEVNRLQDLANAAEAEVENARNSKNEFETQIQAKIEENAYLAQELLQTQERGRAARKEVTEAAAELQSLKLMSRQIEIKKQLEEQRRQKEAEANKGFFGSLGF
jgi:hypothetical protein